MNPSKIKTERLIKDDSYKFPKCKCGVVNRWGFSYCPVCGREMPRECEVNTVIRWRAE